MPHLSKRARCFRNQHLAEINRKPLWQEVDERNAKLLQTLSEATDMLAKADEMQVRPGGRSSTKDTQQKNLGKNMLKFEFSGNICCFMLFYFGTGWHKGSVLNLQGMIVRYFGAMITKQTILKHKNLIFWNCGEFHEIFRDPACFFGMLFQEGWRHVKRLKELNIFTLYWKIVWEGVNKKKWWILNHSQVYRCFYGHIQNKNQRCIHHWYIYMYIYTHNIYLGLVPKTHARLRDLVWQSGAGGFVGDIHGRHQGSSREGCQGHTTGGLRIVDLFPVKRRG